MADVCFICGRAVQETPLGTVECKDSNCPASFGMPKALWAAVVSRSEGYTNLFDMTAALLNLTEAWKVKSEELGDSLRWSDRMLGISYAEFRNQVADVMGTYLQDTSDYDVG